MPYWTTTESFELHVLHVEQLTDVDPVGGRLTAAPFFIPESIDVKEIEGLVIFDCDTNMVSSKYGFQVPALGIQCLKEGNILCIRGFCDNQIDDEQVVDCSQLLDNPCELKRKLECCRIELCVKENKVSVKFKDRAVTFLPKNKEHIALLNTMILEACEDCDKQKCKPNNMRGKRMRHSCAPDHYCGCG